MRGGPWQRCFYVRPRPWLGAQSLPAQAQVSDAPPLSPPLSPPSLDPSIKPLPPPPEGQTSPPPAAAVPEASPSQPLAAPDAAPGRAAIARRRPGRTAGDPVVAAIRSQLADPAICKDADADDVAALAAFYAARTEGPLWVTEMGFSARGQAAIFEIENADDWGLDAKAFALPSASELPGSPAAQALAELKLDLAILKYARFARGGRLVPAKVSELLDQTPPAARSEAGVERYRSRRGARCISTVPPSQA